MTRRKTQSVEATTNPNFLINDDHTPKMSPYELSREERIKSNRERMQKLGLVDLSLKLHSLTAPKRTPRNNPSPAKHPSPLPSSGPLRRSSRLHNGTPVTYSEAVLAKKVGLLEEEDVRLDVGSKPEVYTEEHEKLLGSTEKSWTPFVDGCGKDGKRIYDQVKGKTCHQCRQKTLGHRTHCSKCKIVQGQFCGDCLYMRYGEHVLEAIENPNWICPVCRGICNCSLCRQAKGWAPTGALYRKISSLGYKSVAHYLIQTQRSQNSSEKVTISHVSAKRSLPFSEMEVPSERPPVITDEHIGVCEPRIHGQLKIKEDEQLPNIRNLTTYGQTKCSLPSEIKSGIMGSVEVNDEAHEHLGVSEPNSEDKGEGEAPSGCLESAEANHEICSHAWLSELPMFEGKRGSDFKGEEEKRLQPMDEEHDNSNIILEGSPKLEKKRAMAFKPISDFKQSANMFCNQEEPKEVLQFEDDKCTDTNIVLETSPKLKKKTARSAEPNPDSIGGRLRQRRRMAEGNEESRV